MSEYSFKWFHPDMSDALDVSIAYDFQWRSSGGRDYEEIDPYVETIYAGNVDITPLLDAYTVKMALDAYHQHLKEKVYED